MWDVRTGNLLQPLSPALRLPLTPHLPSPSFPSATATVLAPTPFPPIHTAPSRPPLPPPPPPPLDFTVSAIITLELTFSVRQEITQMASVPSQSTNQEVASLRVASAVCGRVAVTLGLPAWRCAVMGTVDSSSSDSDGSSSGARVSEAEAGGDAAAGADAAGADAGSDAAGGDGGGDDGDATGGGGGGSVSGGFLRSTTTSMRRRLHVPESPLRIVSMTLSLWFDSAQHAYAAGGAVRAIADDAASALGAEWLAGIVVVGSVAGSVGAPPQQTSGGKGGNGLEDGGSGSGGSSGSSGSSGGSSGVSSGLSTCAVVGIAVGCAAGAALAAAALVWGFAGTAAAAAALACARVLLRPQCRRL
ncbi:hypothetical protein FOA52_005486 [Chlamydomonas sp. UWO 241]|nr:hypothetical protein FOA52_005486 [Chlamydomonas sp. UWO 241]